MFTLALTATLAAAGWFSSLSLADPPPLPPHAGLVICGSNAPLTYAPPTNTVNPAIYLRKYRVKIRTPGGSVGIRVDTTNAAPVVLMSSINGGPWAARCVITNEFATVEVPATNGCEFFRLSSVPVR